MARLSPCVTLFALLLSCTPGVEQPPCGSDVGLSAKSASANQREDAAPLYRGIGDPFGAAPLPVRSYAVPRCQAPAALQIHAPATPGRYAVIQFQHGYLVSVAHYSELLSSVAANGFVVIAPQMYPPSEMPVGQPTISEEAGLLRAVLDWMPNHLEAVIDVTPDLEAVGLAGHSRGAKVAWLAASEDPGRLRAFAGIDPMDGTTGGWTRVLDGSNAIQLPSLIFGAGLGGIRPDLVGIPCAPEGANHEQFYAASPSPAWHVVAPEAGHADMLNEDVAGCGTPCSYCPAGPDANATRRLVGGLLVAFFRATLQGDAGAAGYLADPALAPMSVWVETR